MSRREKSLLGLAVAAGLCAATLEGAPRPKPPAPPPTCPGCPIVYVQTKDFGNSGDLMLMQEDGTDKTVVLPGSKGESYGMPVWAPDGQWIAVSSNREDGISRTWFVRWDGEYATQALTPCGGSTAFVWRPVPTPGTTKYWVAYWDSCATTPEYSLWAVQVDHGQTPPQVSTEPFCLTCELTCDDSPCEYGTPAWASDGMHLSAVRGVGMPYTWDYRVFDFIDSDPPGLEGGKSLDITGLGIDNNPIEGDWAHGRYRLVVYNSPRPSDLSWFDVDHDVEQMITGWGCLTPGDDGWNYEGPRWSQDDSKLLYFASSSREHGYFLSSFEDFVRPMTSIAPPTNKSEARSSNWNPNPNPLRP